MGQYIARYGAMRCLGVFVAPTNDRFPLGTKVIVRTSRGLETGVVLCEATEEAVARLEPGFEQDRIVRIMTREDAVQLKRIRLEEENEFHRCKKIIRDMNMEMGLVRLEHVFGGERIIVYYVADARVDFRELVKVLASEFQTRIEMRQIGARDETRILADVGDCGRDVCCNSYLIAMSPVSLRMARMQKATLDPVKISGRCGRLKCCLRYEFDTYVEMQEELPGIGKRVHTPDGLAKVISHEILQQKVGVEFSDQTRKMFPASELRLMKHREHVPSNIDMSDSDTLDWTRFQTDKSILANHLGGQEFKRPKEEGENGEEKDEKREKQVKIEKREKKGKRKRMEKEKLSKK
ncbi:MAG: PSP1 domain-containing protein [Thermoguttaceae bacterium]